MSKTNLLDLTAGGMVHKAYGHLGAMRISFDVPVEILFSSDDDRKFLFLQIMGSLVPYRVQTMEPLDTDVYKVKLKYIDTPEDASEFVKSPVFIERERLPEDVRESDLHGLEGFEVLDLDGRRLGTIKEVMEYPQQLMAILTDEASQEHLLPLVEEWIKAVDPELRYITMELPEGLLE